MLMEKKIRNLEKKQRAVPVNFNCLRKKDTVEFTRRGLGCSGEEEDTGTLMLVMK